MYSTHVTYKFDAKINDFVVLVDLYKNDKLFDSVAVNEKNKNLVVSDWVNNGNVNPTFLLK